jgi:two-component system CheB/CheR fusion protein
MIPWFIPGNVHIVHGASTELFTPGWVIHRATWSDMGHPTENDVGTGRGTTPSAHDLPNYQHVRLRSALGWIASHLSRIFLEEDIRLSHVFQRSPQKKEPMAPTSLASATPQSDEISCPEYVHSKQDFLLQGVLHSLTEHIAVLDADGTIITVNEAWDRFARENGATDLRYTSIGVN